MIDLSILIPFLNEEENIPNLISTIDFFCGNWNKKIEVIFIDDGSTDNSVKMISEFKVNHFEKRIIKLSKNFGSHAALRAGIMHAKGEFISFLYADLQDPIEVQKKLYNTATEGNYDLVWGNRAKTNNSFPETLFSRLYSSLMKKYVNKNYPEKGFDIALFNKKVQSELNQNIESNSSIFLQMLSLGFSQEFVEYEKEDRKAGKSKWTLQKKIKLFIDSFVAFSYFPIKLVTISGVLFFILGFIWTIYIIGRKLIVDDLESGWPALISVLMIGFGVTNIGIGIVAEYLWRTLDASQNRPVFIIDKIITFNDEQNN